MVPPLEESEDGNRVSFPRWGKRNVFSSHFTELDLKITEMGRFPGRFKRGLFYISGKGYNTATIKESREQWTKNVILQF